MRWLVVFVVSWLGLAGAVAATHLRHGKPVGTFSNRTVVSRALASEHNHFEALSCNNPECNKGTTTWTKQNYDTENKKVIIPCGLCVTMDYIGDDEQVLYLPHGLEVQGTLRFPNNYRLTIETPFVIVQGSLKMTSTRVVTDTPLIQVRLTGTNEVSFLPIGNNKEACNGSSCSVGVQPIVVAGGDVELRGVPPTCKTWTILKDVVLVNSATEPSTLEYPRATSLDPTHKNPVCRKYVPYVNDDFESATLPSLWTGGYGAHYDWSRGFLRVSGRKDPLEHAPTLDLLPFQDCLIAGETYLFSARIRLRNEAIQMGTPTTCNDAGDDCLILQSTTVLPNSRIGSRKGREFPSDAFVYGRWETFYTSFTFSTEEVDKDAFYQLLRLRGPAPEIDIDVDDVSFGLVPPSLFPDPENVCGGNLIMNGDAEASSMHPYPMQTPGGQLKIVTSRNGNRIFRLTDRASDTDALLQDLAAPQCIMTGAQYIVRARIRFVSTQSARSFMKLRIHFKNGSSTQIDAATCSVTAQAWDECNGKFTVVEDFEPSSVVSVRAFFVTEGSPHVTMDVDDWEIKVSRPAKSGIIVESDGVSDCWGEGARIALTSHTLDRNDAQVRQLVSAPVDLGDGTVRLELDDVIIFPVTEKQDKDFAVEVLLLNRNIRFEGGNEQNNKGGHFMVMHTPRVTQLISGVEFRNFGRLGEFTE